MNDVSWRRSDAIEDQKIIFLCGNLAHLFLTHFTLLRQNSNTRFAKYIILIQSSIFCTISKKSNLFGPLARTFWRYKTKYHSHTHLDNIVYGIVKPRFAWHIYPKRWNILKLVFSSKRVQSTDLIYLNQLIYKNFRGWPALRTWALPKDHLNLVQDLFQTLKFIFVKKNK